MLRGFSGHLISEHFLETELVRVGYRPGSDANTGAGARRARLAFQRRRTAKWLGPASSIHTIFEASALPLIETLGFEAPDRVDRRSSFIVATLRPVQEGVILLSTSWDERLDRYWRHAVDASRHRQAMWALLFNGTRLRLVDVARAYMRRFAEFDLDLVLDDERSFAVLWQLLHRDAFAMQPEAKQSWIHDLVEQSEHHASGVSRSLRQGVLCASQDVLNALIHPAVRRNTAQALGEAFEQSLTVVYRVLFLLFAEARGLVPLWHPVYRESYSIESLRRLAEDARSSAGFWNALRAIARLAHGGCRAGDLHVTAFNGRLFAPTRTPLADRPDLDDDAALRAILALSTRAAKDRGGREPIAYRDLGVEQLGAVYETLLDYEPRPVERAAGPWTERRRVSAFRDASREPARRGSSALRGLFALVRGSGVRKATGSFYTPQPLAEYLVRRTLGPLVHAASPDRILQLRVVDPAMGSGAFLVAACRFLAEAYEAALQRSGGYGAGDFDETERTAIRRTIAERCLYGVDSNPMAVQLARLSLWLTTLAADKPLTFLDHHLQTGDSLLGAWLASLRDSPRLRAARRKPDHATMPLFDDEGVATALKAALPIRFSLAERPGDTIEDVRTKERALASLKRPGSPLSKWRQVADVWCAPWFAHAGTSVPAAAFGALSDAILGRTRVLRARTAEAYLSAATSIAQRQRLLHWELEFPEVFFDANGARLARAGFDALIGNPPWDMVRADDGPTEHRRLERSAAAAVIRFTRDSGAYVAQSSGHGNRYQLFLERSIALTRPGGRIGMVLPAGLATDEGSAPLRRHLFTHCDVEALVGFENQQAVFPIHRSVRFLLLTAVRGTPTKAVACRLGVRTLSALQSMADEASANSSEFPVRVTLSLLRRVSGDGLAIPDLRSPLDVAILERAATLFPPLGDVRGWNARFGRELNVTDDRHHFLAAGRGLPVVEGKHVNPFRVDRTAARYSIAPSTAGRLLAPARYERPRLAYRDVASATNRLTFIAAVLPAGCLSTHTLFCLRTPLSRLEQDFLCGLFNSFILNYFVRLRVATHVTTAIVEQLPVPTRQQCPREVREIAALSRILQRQDNEQAFDRLQALVAAVYQLSDAEFQHVLETFPLIPRERRDAARQLLNRVRTTSS